VAAAIAAWFAAAIAAWFAAMIGRRWRGAA
jgi:hypothetical protein